jgi:hypothetical protein
MEINKSQKRLLIFLAIVVAFFIIDVINNPETYSKFYSGSSKKQKVAEKTENTEITKTKAEVTFQAALSNWGTNPFYIVPKRSTSFRTQETVQVVEVKLVLQATNADGENSFALINDKIVKTGEMVAGYTVISISKTRVVLSDGQKRKELTLAN